jgi:hypothetical protein
MTLHTVSTLRDPVFGVHHLGAKTMVGRGSPTAPKLGAVVPGHVAVSRTIAILYAALVGITTIFNIRCPSYLYSWNSQFECSVFCDRSADAVHDHLLFLVEPCHLPLRGGG